MKETIEDLRKENEELHAVIAKLREQQAMRVSLCTIDLEDVTMLLFGTYNFHPEWFDPAGYMDELRKHISSLMEVSIDYRDQYICDTFMCLYEDKFPIIVLGSLDDEFCEGCVMYNVIEEYN